ncbi:hypothetical protein [Nocardioides pocheonensis]|jgi:hypothetical protein|uniref:Uncharacterized protein n=1 Tax=Nocardioides pocheonensis TaxID=661485 RepID=A0A3N0GZL0_9ACTN|nr:hypothetical protein EFL26_01830 [Nocardioides pocheonensis]
MELIGGWVLPAAWAGLGLTIVVCALLASRSSAALTAGIAAVSVLWVVAGAGANLAMLLDGTTYTGFADGSAIPFVRDTWESLVVPHHHLFIGLLIAGEALAGVLVLVPGRLREGALVALVCFNATLVVFGWAFAIWAVPLVVALVLLLRAQRAEDPPLRSPRRRPSAGASSARHRSPRSRVPSP